VAVTLVVRLADGEIASIRWRMPLDVPDTVFVRYLDEMDGTRSEPTPLRADTQVVEVVEAAPARGEPEQGKGDPIDPVQRGSARQGALL